MTKEELKKKIVEVIREFRDSKPIVPNDYGLQIISGSTDRELADALIAAGLCDKNTLDEKYQTLMAAGFVQLASLRLDFEKVLHRAEVAERALDKATELAYTYRTQDDTLSCSSCPFDSIFDRCKERGLYENCSKRWKEELLQQSEKELQEEKKSD